MSLHSGFSPCDGASLPASLVGSPQPWQQLFQPRNTCETKPCYVTHPLLKYLVRLLFSGLAM